MNLFSVKFKKRQICACLKHIFYNQSKFYIQPNGTKYLIGQYNSKISYNYIRLLSYIFRISLKFNDPKLDVMILLLPQFRISLADRPICCRAVSMRILPAYEPQNQHTNSSGVSCRLGTQQRTARSIAEVLCLGVIFVQLRCCSVLGYVNITPPAAM